ncbi:hypothetical protein T261_1840 [Streptomyces lydicus]|nr:hypothetical protein T261_1840 [Streptomyces lydicus]
MSNASVDRAAAPRVWYREILVRTISSLGARALWDWLRSVAHGGDV